jgi:hypothetical protein
MPSIEHSCFQWNTWFQRRRLEIFTDDDGSKVIIADLFGIQLLIGTHIFGRIYLTFSSNGRISYGTFFSQKLVIFTFSMEHMVSEKKIGNLYRR